MREGWELRRMEDLCRITRGASPRPINEWISSNGTPWVKIADATRSKGRTIDVTRERIRDEGREKSVVVQPGDLIVSNSATPGIPKFMGIEACIHDGWLLLRDFAGATPEFLYYRILVDRPFLVGQGNGSVFTNLKTAILKSHMIPLPPMEEQRRIAGVLGALDNLIEVNRGLIDRLADMQSAAFGFVGSGYSASAGPDVAFGDVLPVFGGSTPSTKSPEFWDGGEFHWVTPKDLSRLPSTPLRSTERRITKAGLAKITSGLLPVGTLLMSSRAPVGYLAIAEVPTAINQGFIAIKGSDELPSLYLLEWLRAHMGEVLGLANGSTFQEISKRNFKTLKLAVPTAQEVARFMRIAEPCHRQIVALEDEIDELGRARDALLPLLMSGRVRVGEVAM